MNVGVKYAVFLVTSVLALSGCGTLANDPVEKWFNQEEFVGLEDLSSSYDAVTLAYGLDGQSGNLVSFKRCKDVEDAKESDIVQSQFPLYRKLQINCMGVKFFHTGSVAEQDYLPDDFSQNLVSQLPAVVVPNQGGSSLKIQNVQVLSEREAVNLVGESDKQFTLTVGTTEVDYVLLAEVDTNNDGFQDWVLRLDWSQIDSFGEGTDLIVLTRKSRAGEIEVLTRFP